MLTQHNIVLPGGHQTAPGLPRVDQSGVFITALHELGEIFPAHDATVADLGCLEGGYAAEFARAGYDVTGIEVRQENYEGAVAIQAALGLPNLRFICGDAREVLPGMSFDAVFCSGLLYHLDAPVAFLNLLGRVTRRLLILNTHFSLAGGHPEEVHQANEHCRPGGDSHEGRTGHWFEETATRWSSYGNQESFWLCKEDLIASLHAAGFADVSERPGWTTAATPLPPGGGGAFADRGMFIALKGNDENPAASRVHP